MSNELMNLANSLPADLIEQLQQQAAQDIARLGATGGKDTIRVTQDKRFELPNGTQVDEFEAHIVEFVYRNEYYLSNFNRKALTPPACFAIAESSSGLEPSDNSPMKQNKTDCGSCQQNQFGSSPTGDGKACKNTVMLALLPVDDSVATHDIWVLKTSPTAIRPFNSYAAKISQMNIPLSVVKTRIFLDPDSTYASVRFEAKGVEGITCWLLTSARKKP